MKLLRRPEILCFYPPLINLETVTNRYVILFELRVQQRRLLLLLLLAVLDGLTDRAWMLSVEGLRKAGF